MKGFQACCQALRWWARPVRSAKSCGRCSTSIRSPSAPSNSSPRSRSIGETACSLKGKTYPVEAIRPEAFVGVDIVLSSTPASISRDYSPLAAKAGAIVVDNSSAWRMDPDVPLVVPEVNADALRHIPKGIVANPNCSTIQMVVALKPLHDLAKIKRVVVATYRGRRLCEGRPRVSVHSSSTPRCLRAPGPRTAGAGGEGARRPARRQRPAARLESRRGRLLRRRVEDDPRDAQDHGRRVHPGLGHDGARPCSHRPLRGDQSRIPSSPHGRTGPRSTAEKRPRIPCCSNDTNKGEVPFNAACSLRGPRRGVCGPYPPRSDRAARTEPLGRGRQPA